MNAPTDEDDGDAGEPLEVYLDLSTLPENGMEHVLRHLSRVPSAKTWTKYVDLEDLTRLCSVGGDFGPYVHARFALLSIGEMKDVHPPIFDIEERCIQLGELTLNRVQLSGLEGPIILSWTA